MDLFEWSDMVRATDPVTSHEAAAIASEQRSIDRQLVWKLWNQMVDDGSWYATRTIFQTEFLPSLGYQVIRCKSLTRRLSDLVVRPKNAETLWLLCATGEKVGRSQVLTYTERGKLVLADPGIMAGLWGHAKKKDRR